MDNAESLSSKASTTKYVKVRSHIKQAYFSKRSASEPSVVIQKEVETEELQEKRDGRSPEMLRTADVKVCNNVKETYSCKPSASESSVFETEELEAQEHSVKTEAKPGEVCSKTETLQANTDEFPTKTENLPAKTSELRARTVKLQAKTDELQAKTDELQAKTDELAAKTATLRRSRSGRVKVLSRTRSMVSTYDFKNLTEQDLQVERSQNVLSKEEEEAGRRMTMLKRIEKTWPGMDQRLWGDGGSEGLDENVIDNKK